MGWYKDPTTGRWLNNGATSGQAHDRNGATNTGANRQGRPSVEDPRRRGHYVSPDNPWVQREDHAKRNAEKAKEIYKGPAPPNLAQRAAVDPFHSEPFYQRLAGVRQSLAASGVGSAQAVSRSALGARGVSMSGPASAGTYVNDALAAARGGVNENVASDAAGMRFVSRERRVNEARGFQYQQSMEGMKRLLNNWLDNDTINAERYKRVLGTIGQSLGDVYGS